MNVESTRDKMILLKQFGMLRTYDNLLKAGMNELTHDEVIAMLIDSEWDERTNKRIVRQEFGQGPVFEARCMLLDQERGQRHHYGRDRSGEKFLGLGAWAAGLQDRISGPLL